MHNPDKNIPKYYSLAELSASIESVIAKTYHRAYWVKAEIAKLNYYPKSGHCYPDLVEKKDGAVKAQIRGTIWSGYFSEINRKFTSVTKEALADGMTVLFLARVSYSAVYGLSLQITDIEPSFTLGEMAKEKSLSIEKLKKEGLFTRNKDISAPLLLRRIAVISVETSKGYHDFVKTIDNNNWNYKFFHMLFPAVLQGEAAIASITEQLKRIRKVISHFDAVAIIRGGGGDVGLSSFDSYKLSCEVASFPLPVITGIGHATNETVTELVAWENKITPTDVAYFLIQKYHNFSVRIENAEKSVIDKSLGFLSENRNDLRNISMVLKSATDNIINVNHNYLRQQLLDLKYVSKKNVEIKKQLVQDVVSSLSYNPRVILSDSRHDLDKHITNLIVYSKSLIKQSHRDMLSLEDKVQLLKPENVLKRGYSITLKDGKPVTSYSNLNKDDELETVLYKGKIKSRISEIKED